MALRCRNREYWYSTNDIDYSVWHNEVLCKAPEEPFTCHGGFMMVSWKNKCLRIIQCLACKSGRVDYDEEDHSYPLQEESIGTEHREGNYYQFQQQRFKTELRSLYPDVTCADVSKITETFIEILQIANTTHTCPDDYPCGGLGTTITHHVDIRIQPPRVCRTPPLPQALDLIQDCASYKASSGPRAMTPATTTSIMGLLRLSDDNANGEDCSICMEKIMEKSHQRNDWLLKMPCSHSFHRACLINWLNNSHLCPLCRYPMPQPQFK